MIVSIFGWKKKSSSLSSMTLRGHLVSGACPTHCPSVFHPIDQQLTTTVRVLHWNRTPEVAAVVGQQPTVARISFAYRESNRAELKEFEFYILFGNSNFYSP
ncbi:UDP-N-acetylmuramate--L-alanine ligase [Trichinella spiralis]|uniref:UDP-N-acetylmuramate--L-alanine ligase n=1 Tax=Trichinella spiralis TaxID=6334 RepID=A0ABR3KMR8_TRISP